MLLIVNKKEKAMPVKVKVYEASDGYSDKYVSRGKMAFSFLSEDNKMVGPFVDCKDYMNNRLHGCLTDIAGTTQYKWQPQMGPISMEKTRILVCRQSTPDSNEPLLKKITEDQFEEEIKLAMDLLHPLEKDLHLIRSTYDRVTGIKEEYGQVILIEGSRRWMLASPMLSLYLYLLRNAYHHVKGQSYIKTIEESTEYGSKDILAPAVKFIVKNKYAKVFGKSIEKNYPASVGQDLMHVTGILAFGRGLYTASWPHWLFPNKEVAVKSGKKLKETVA